MNLKEMREAAALTQDQAASITALHQSTISQLELGKVPDPRHSTLKKLAAAYNVRVQDVVDALAQSVLESEAA